MSAHIQLSAIEAPTEEAAWADGKAWANAAGLRVATRGKVRRWGDEFSGGRVLWDVEVIVRDPAGWHPAPPEDDVLFAGTVGEFLDAVEAP